MGGCGSLLDEKGLAQGYCVILPTLPHAVPGHQMESGKERTANVP